MGYMKYKVLGSAMLCCSLVSSSYALNNFIQNSLNTAIISEDAGYFKSQVGGHLSGGSLRLRWGGSDNIQLFTARTPKISAGCSGIDMVFGGLSYLDFDMLVEKLKKMAASSPAFAFQIALSTLCKDCQTILAELDKIANAINSMNFDTCQMMQNWTNKITDAINTNLAGGQSDNWIKETQNFTAGFSESLKDFNNMVMGEGGDPTEELATGSLIEILNDSTKNRGARITLALQNLFSNKKDYEALLKSAIGDLYVYINQKTGDTVSLIYAPSLDTEKLMDYFIALNDLQDITVKIPTSKTDDSNNHVANELKDYTIAMNKSLRRILKERLENIVSKLTNGQSLTADDKSLLSGFPIAIIELLNAKATGKITTEQIYDYLSLLVSSSFMKELLTEFRAAVSYFQAKDDKFVTKNKEDFRTIQERIEQIMGKLQLQISEKTGEIYKNIQNQRGIQDILKSFGTTSPTLQ